jgi:hypothetical protein
MALMGFPEFRLWVGQQNDTLDFDKFWKNTVNLFDLFRIFARISSTQSIFLSILLWGLRIALLVLQKKSLSSTKFFLF